MIYSVIEKVKKIHHKTRYGGLVRTTKYSYGVVNDETKKEVKSCFMEYRAQQFCDAFNNGDRDEVERLSRLPE